MTGGKKAGLFGLLTGADANYEGKRTTERKVVSIVRIMFSDFSTLMQSNKRSAEGQRLSIA